FIEGQMAGASGYAPGQQVSSAIKAEAQKHHALLPAQPGTAGILLVFLKPGAQRRDVIRIQSDSDARGDWPERSDRPGGAGCSDRRLEAGGRAAMRLPGRNGCGPV